MRIEEREKADLYWSPRLSKWDIIFMSLARTVGQNSSCLSRKIGAVLVRDNSVISTGWNGPARGIPHCENRNPNKEITCPRKYLGYKSGEGLHLCLAAHAERNCLINAARMGVATKDSTLYCDCLTPCKDCLTEIINAGVIEVVCNLSGSPTNNFGKFYDETSEYILDNSSLIIRFIDFKKE